VELAYRCILCDVPFNVLKKTPKYIDIGPLVVI
jgi:hypothetical protein